jgi:uncharacterized protein YPO0396
MLAGKEVIAMGDSVVQLEPRVAKIEAAVAYISSRVANMEIDLRDMRKSMDQKFDTTNGELRGIRAEMSTEFKAMRGEMSTEFKAMRGEMSAEFKAMRGEANEESTDVRDRLSSLRLLIVVLAIAMILATKGSESYHTIVQWLSHFK